MDEMSVVHKLYQRGISLNEITDITDIPIDTLRMILSTDEPLPQEEEVRERSLRLANEAFDQAFKTLRFGPAPARQALMRTLISASAKSLGRDDASNLEDLRLALERLLGQSKLREMATEGIPLAELDPPTIGTDNPN